MTVSYNIKVSDTETRAFLRLFCRWRGSVWKAIYKELILWLFIYYTFNLTYRFVMNTTQKKLIFNNFKKFFRF